MNMTAFLSFLAALQTTVPPPPEEDQAQLVAQAIEDAANSPPASQTCVSRPEDMEAAEAALLSPEHSPLEVQLIYYRSARAAGLPDCEGE